MTRQAKPPAAQRRMRDMIGAVCRDARKQLDMTQTQVAAGACVSKEFYARIERGQALPSVPTLAALAESLGLSTDEMLGLAERSQGHGYPAALQGYPPRVLQMLPMLQRASPGALKLVAKLLRTLRAPPTSKAP